MKIVNRKCDFWRSQTADPDRRALRIENEDLTLRIAEGLKKITAELGCDFVFKASYDKANRTSVTSYRGLGMDEGLRILARVKSELLCR